ncbi:MAG: alanine racemase [Actinomycetota bacterium]
MIHHLSIWAEIDTGAIRRNVQRVKATLSPGTTMLGVVKANGYGHGEVEAARAVIEGGADWLGVARVEEGAALRRAGIGRPILLLAEPPLGAVQEAVAQRLTGSIYTEPILRAFAAAARRAGSVAGVHLKVDTGMHRYGVPPGRVAELMDLVDSLEGVRLEGLWTHFAVAEEVSSPFTQQQFKLFKDVVDALGERGARLIRHLCNSAGILTLAEGHFDMVRTGILAYGIHPSPGLAHLVELEPAMSVKSRVGLTKYLAAGEALSYGQRYHMPADGFVSTVPCGYADGLRRALSNNGEVLIRGRRFRICGTITMDHFLVDTGTEEFPVGEEVVILGRQGDERITAQQIADRLKTIPYEVVCGISSRVARIYMD